MDKDNYQLETYSDYGDWSKSAAKDLGWNQRQCGKIQIWTALMIDSLKSIGYLTKDVYEDDLKTIESLVS